MAYRFIVEIPDHEYIGDKVYYSIEITNVESNAKKDLKKRYSELEMIHSKIIDWINIFKIKIPQLQFPKKKILFSTNKSEECVLKRRLELQVYLNEVLQHSDLYGLDAIQEFIPVEKIQNLQESKLTNLKSDMYWSEIEELKKSYLAKYENQAFSLPQSKYMNQKIQQYTFKFEDHNIEGHTAIYNIQINDQLTGKNWKFCQRYKDLREQNHQLKKLKLTFELPEFPEKKFVDLNEEFNLQERKRELENYLNSIFKYQEIVKSDVMVFFIAKSQLFSNEFGCRSNAEQKNNIDSSRMKSKSTIINQKVEQDIKVSRKITC